MTFFDEARALLGMIKMKKMTQSEIAELLGTSQSYVANKLRLLKLSDEAQKRIIELGLSERHARCLLRIKDEEKVFELIEKFHDMKANVAVAEALADTVCDRAMPTSLLNESQSTGIERFEEILKKSLISLRSIGIDVDYRTSYFGSTKYITIAVAER